MKFSDATTHTGVPPASIPWVDRINLFFHYRRYIKMFVRRWPVLLGAALIATGVMAYKAKKAPDIYVASSKIGVAAKLNKPNVQSVTVAEELNFFYDNQIGLLGGQEVMANVSHELEKRGLTNSPRILQAIAGRDKGNLTLTVRSTDFDYAKAFAIFWAHAFLEYKNQQRQGLINKSAQTTREELIDYEKKLTLARQEMLDFQKKFNIASVRETGDSLQKRYDDLTAEYHNLSTLRQRLENQSKEDLADGGLSEQKVIAIKDGENKSAVPVIEKVDPLAKYLESSSYSKLKLELRQREAQAKDLAATLKPQHPFLVKLNQEVSRIQDSIRFELEMIEAKRLARINSLKGEEEALKPVVDKLRQELFESRDIQARFEKLKEDEGQIKGVVERLQKQLQELQLTPVDESQFDILEEGAGARHPVEPNRMKMIMTGLLAGLVIGIGIVYFLDKLDDRLELAEEIEAALKEPVLGQLPQTPVTGERKSLLVTELDEYSMFAEALRGVRSAVLLGFQNERKKVLIVTSAVPGDGKTTFTTNFAITLAMAGHRILLVDADLRRGNTHSFFGNSRDNGFSEVLLGEQHWTDVLRQTPIETLKVIHSGKLPPNPGELLISPIPAQLIEEAREEFDFVIFDCPPLTAIDDTFSLIPLADGILFVVRSAQTSMRFARNSLHAVKQRSGQILGLVLNGITPDNPYYYYQSYYHRYYSPAEKTQSRSTAPMPVRKMATPRKGTMQSIEEAARAFSREEGTQSPVSKAEAYKQRRIARKNDPTGSAKSAERDV